MPPHKIPPKKKSTKKKATPRKAGSKIVAKTRVTKPRKREPRVVPEVEPVDGSMLIDLEKTRLATGARSMASAEPEVFRDLPITDVKVNGEERSKQEFPSRVAPEILSHIQVPYVQRNQGLEESYREMLHSGDYQSAPPGVPYTVDDNGNFPSVKMWERVEIPKDEHALNLPLYRRLWNWIKSVW